MRSFSTQIYKPLRYLLLAFLFIMSCTDPVEPEFEFQEDLVFVDALASTSPGASFVIINKSVIEFGVYGQKFVEDAIVSYTNIDSGTEIFLTEAGESYIPPADFAVVSGERWKLKVILLDGNVYESTPELVLQPVAVNNIEVNYDPELAFREINGGRFVPGHAISVSFDDPSDEENYYYWKLSVIRKSRVLRQVF